MEVAQDSFISSTYWTEKIGLVAAIATIEKLRKHNIPQDLVRIGKEIQEGWKNLAKKYGLDIEISGMYPIGHFLFKYNNPLVLKTLFTQLMLEKGFLATDKFYASYAHKQSNIEKYLDAVDEVFKHISKIIKEGNPEKYLKGPICHAGFKRLT